MVRGLAVRLWLSFSLLVCFAAPAFAEVVNNITVKGNAKVESDAIITILKTQKGEILNSENVREDIKALYALKYFSDIRVYKSPSAGGVDLIIEVKELPSIMEIKFDGLKELSEDDFKDKLETKLYTIANEATITTDLRNIEKLYVEKGYYLARATYTLDPKDGKEQEVSLNYHVTEGGKVQVGDVHIIGNHYFSDVDLISKFISKPKTRSSAYGSPGSAYNDEFVKRDVEVLSYLYKDQGFAEVKVAKALSVLDPDREYARVTMELEEGIQYSVATIDFSGDLLFTNQELLEAMKLKPDKLFRFSYFRKDIEMLIDKYGDKGFAFVDVNPVHRFDREKKLVYLNYEIAKGEKVYFGDMTVTGNTKTRDNVIRRELEVSDTELYSGTKLTESKKNIERLGFFEEVQSIKKRDTDQSAVLHYRFKVKEKPTGQLQAAIGWSPSANRTSETNLFGQGRYNEENQSGRGWKSNLTAKWNGGKNYSLDLGFTDPRLNDSKWSLGFGAFLSNEVRNITTGISVQERRAGGNVTVGHDIYDDIRGAVTYEWSKITQESDAFLFQRFKDEGIASSVVFAIYRNKTDNYIEPTEGYKWRLSQRFSGGKVLKGDRNYRESKAEGDYYLPFDFTDTYRTFLHFRSNVGALMAPDGLRVPFSVRYRLGGPEDLRGYEYRQVGPTFNILQAPGDQVRPIVKGGDKFSLVQLEYFFPIIPDANIKGLFFADGGRVFDDSDPISLKDYQRDVGFGFRWMTPIAPFRFEWAYPYKDGRLGDLEFIFYLGY